MNVKVTLTKNELRVLMHLVDVMTASDAHSMDFKQVEIAELYLKLVDAWDFCEMEENLKD